MDVNGIASLATTMAETRTAQTVSIAVLKKSMDMQGAVATAMINAATQATPATPNLPPNLGKNINTVA